jgi:hypothetical protein
MSLSCSIPVAPYVAACQGSIPVPGDGQRPCFNVGPNRHVIYSYIDKEYGPGRVVTTESRKVYCPSCCPACRAKKEKEAAIDTSSSTHTPQL